VDAADRIAKLNFKAETVGQSYQFYALVLIKGKGVTLESIQTMESDDGWYVLAIKSGVSPRAFFDVAFSQHSSRSYAAAKEHNDALRPYAGAVRNHQNQGSDKGHPELPVGITLATHTKLNRGGKGSPHSCSKLQSDAPER
jgi:hypothetical protein